MSPLEDQIIAATAGNSSFSQAIPGLQLGVDSTSLGTFKECPRKYFYSIVLGYQPRAESAHLRFGLELHKALETYHQARVGGSDFADGLDAALSQALCATWEPRLQRPWMSDHPQKNRISLIRSVVWYLERYGEDQGMETLRLANGRAAVELSFRFDSGASAYGEQILFCGHLDRLVAVGDRLFVADPKTTGSLLTPKWFQGFTPGNQFSMYTAAGRVAFSQPVEGVIVDGIQVGVEFSRFDRGLVPRPGPVIDEWLSETRAYWLPQMALAADAQSWPQNDKACGNYGGCAFAGVCGRSPALRAAQLKLDFVKRTWDPLVARGDI